MADLWAVTSVHQGEISSAKFLCNKDRQDFQSLHQVAEEPDLLLQVPNSKSDAQGRPCGSDVISPPLTEAAREFLTKTVVLTELVHPFYIDRETEILRTCVPQEP